MRAAPTDERDAALLATLELDPILESFALEHEFELAFRELVKGSQAEAAPVVVITLDEDITWRWER